MKSETYTYWIKDETSILQLNQQINQTYKQIDQMVYELYELKEKEITIVEEATAQPYTFAITHGF